jgi:hypothetical protein
VPEEAKLQNELRFLFCDQVVSFRTVARITCEADLTKAVPWEDLLSAIQDFAGLPTIERYTQIC